MRASYQRLYVNIDHAATLRQARRGIEPDPVAAAIACERAGADGITAHLREDRRHIQDHDVEGLRKNITTYFNLEMACTPEMLAIAQRIRPEQVTLVPERREEVTTEGGLDVRANASRIQEMTAALQASGIRVSLFIDPDEHAVTTSRDVGADAIELHTGQYAHHPADLTTLAALQTASTLAATLGLAVHAGHGLTVANVSPVAAIPEIEELNIGHSIISRAIFIGLPAAIAEIRAAMNKSRA